MRSSWTAKHRRRHYAAFRRTSGAHDDHRRVETRHEAKTMTCSMSSDVIESRGSSPWLLRHVGSVVGRDMPARQACPRGRLLLDPTYASCCRSVNAASRSERPTRQPHKTLPAHTPSTYKVGSRRRRPRGIGHGADVPPPTTDPTWRHSQGMGLTRFIMSQRSWAASPQRPLRGASRPAPVESAPAAFSSDRCHGRADRDEPPHARTHRFQSHGRMGRRRQNPGRCPVYSPFMRWRKALPLE